nr:DUF6544 family protein [Anaerobacillus sp. CMMVII]
MKWQSMDLVTAIAIFTKKKIDVTGIFHFDETGKFIRLETDDCYYNEKGSLPLV